MQQRNEYTIIADGGRDYTFLFDRNLQLGDKTAIIIDERGQIEKNITEELEHFIVSGTFYENKSLLLSLDNKTLMLYDLLNKKTSIRNASECQENYLEDNQFFLLNDSIAIFVTTSNYGNGDYTGKDIFSINMKSGEKKQLDEDIGVMYKMDKDLFYTKGFNKVYLINKDLETSMVVELNKNVLNLNCNSIISGYITWEGLSNDLEELWQKKIDNYSERLIKLSLINSSRYSKKYCFELWNNKHNNLLFQDTFPKKNKDIKDITILDDNYVMLSLFDRAAPNEESLLIYNIKAKEYFPILNDINFLDYQNGFLITGNKTINILNLNTFESNEISNSNGISDKYMSKNCCGNYYYSKNKVDSTVEIGYLDFVNKRLKAIRHIVL